MKYIMVVDPNDYRKMWLCEYDDRTDTRGAYMVISQGERIAMMRFAEDNHLLVEKPK